MLKKDIKALASKLKKFRARAGINVREAGARAGISYATISRLENGLLERPSETTLRSVAALVRAPKADLERWLG